MRIERARCFERSIALTRPYAIASHSVDDVRLFFVEITAGGARVGRGSASPEPHVTGERQEDCRDALSEERLSWLEGCDVRELNALLRMLSERTSGAPAARAAVDMALHDLFAQLVGLPLVDLLGRAQRALPTSITIGIKDVADTLAEAEEYRARGFRVLKVKLGRDAEEDVERLVRLRERFGASIAIRVDPNQGYDATQVRAFVERTRNLEIELLEQPTPAGDLDAMRSLPEAVRARLAADESLLDEGDALALLGPPRACGIFNIKLMKCGGIRHALRVAALAETAGVSLMWGCMDESVISISAALHAALSSPATRYLDLDGSFDLASDVATGGFALEGGVMRTLDAPGLGVRVADGARAP